MSRSTKRPFIHICSHDSNDKRIANKLFRAKTKDAIVKGNVLPDKLKEVSDVLGWSSDGKCYYQPDYYNATRK